MSLRAKLVALCVLVLPTLGQAGVARADVFGTISLLSASPFGQAEYAHDPALSEDGRYVVFDGAIAGVQGVWRREARPGANFEQVAGGDATLPSVSADARYVSFTTNQGGSLPAITDGQIHAGAVEEAPSVYVRDMAIAPGEPGAFTLVSAKDHSTQSLVYEFPGLEEEQVAIERPKYGAVAAGRSAITADGRTVVFVTTAQSDLAAPGTPKLQVAVRHLDTDETQLVSVRFDPATGQPALNAETGAPEPVPEEEGRYGAVWTRGTGAPSFTTAQSGSVTRAYEPPSLPGAAISADGSTVAWYGGQIAEQTRTLSGESSFMKLLYGEPLWRRIGNGPSEPTRRVTGGSEPENPGCLANPEAELPSTPVPGDPCQGPFAARKSGGIWNGGENSDYVPRLSANGNYVAFLASAPLISEGAAFGIPGSAFNSDAYREDMTAPTRASGLQRLSQFASGDTTRISTNADVLDLGISPDGQQVAFSTRRTAFPLGAPAFVSSPSAVPGLVELFEADLADETLTRVTRGYEGGVPEHSELESANEDRYTKGSDGSLSPSFDASGQLLAFSSTASNLVFGDGSSPANSGGEVDGADVFLVPRIVFSAEPTPQAISPAPGNPSLEPSYRLIVTATSLANGTVQLKARVPAAGKLAASATSALPASSSRVHKKKKRTVARASAPARGGTPVKLNLQLTGRYRGLALRAGGLRGTVTVTFSAKGHPTLRKTLVVHFVHRTAHRRHKKGR